MKQRNITMAAMTAMLAFTSMSIMAEGDSKYCLGWNYDDNSVTHVYKYNDQGLCTSMRSTSEAMRTLIQNEYNEQNYLTKRSNYISIAGKQFSLVNTYIYSYTRAGKIASLQIYDAHDKLTQQQLYVYDENNGRTSTMNETVGNTRTFDSYFYDIDGREVLQYATYPDSVGTPFASFTSSAYDVKGQLVTLRKQDADGSGKVCYFTYDDNGKMSKAIEEFILKGVKSSTTEITYTRDENGDVILAHKIMVSPDGLKKEDLTYTYTYSTDILFSQINSEFVKKQIVEEFYDLYDIETPKYAPLTFYNSESSCEVKFNYSDTADGISSPSKAATGTTSIYSAAGVSCTSLQHGLNIVNENGVISKKICK